MKSMMTLALLSVIFFGFPMKIQANNQNLKKANIYSHSLHLINGEKRSFSSYKGHVILLVNTASKCGYTSQYDGLEKLYQKYKDKGLVVIGFPSNDFGNQEPGSNAEIKKFCKLNYGVSFPLNKKIHVKGESQDPVYGFLTSQAHPEKEVAWNFEKFLVDRNGHVILRFPSIVKPMSKTLTSTIEKHL